MDEGKVGGAPGVQVRAWPEGLRGKGKNQGRGSRLPDSFSCSLGLWPQVSVLATQGPFLHLQRLLGKALRVSED